MSGKLIVIEGLDGSGKATQANLLCNYLKEKGLSVQKMPFPNYESESSALVKMYLNGEFGTDPNDVNAYAASTLFAVDRYAGYKKDWGVFLEGDGIVVADRYTTSNAIHQCFKLPKEQWDKFLNWLYEFEYWLLGIPAPDIVIYLQADVEISQQLISERYHGDERKKDILENNPDYLKHSEQAAEYCKDKLGWKTVHCVKNGVMRPVMEIHKEIRSMI